MAATWRLIFFSTFFFQNFLETWYIYRFSGSASLLVLSFFMWDWKRGCGGQFGFIKFIKFSYFQLIALKPGIYKSHCISRGVFECLHGIFILCPTKLRRGIGIASNVRLNRRLSAFRSRSRSWKPVNGFFNVAHTHPLWGLDVPFGVFEISPT